MGTFLGHFVPGLALIILGLWHNINTIRSYHIKGPTNFASKFWYPFNYPLFKLKHLELIFIFLFSIFAIFTQVLNFPYIHFSFNLLNLEHATMFLHLAIFAGFTLSTELTCSSNSLVLSGILATSVFGQELFLLYYHSADHVGLEGHYHWLLQLVIFISFASALAATASPSSFTAALVLSTSVIFQGFWFLNMGFILWVPKLTPRGCIVKLAEITCLTHEAELRARALANLQFSWILAGISIFTGCVYLKLAGKCSEVVQSIDYERLDSRREDSGQILVVIDESKKTRT